VDKETPGSVLAFIKSLTPVAITNQGRTLAAMIEKQQGTFGYRSEAREQRHVRLKSHCQHGEPGHRHPTVRRGVGGDPGRFALYGESNTRKGDSMAKTAAGGDPADSSVADQLRALG